MFKFPEAEKVRTENIEQLGSTVPNRLFTLCLNFQLSPRGHLGGIVLEIHNIQGPKESFSQSQSSFFFFNQKKKPLFFLLLRIKK